MKARVLATAAAVMLLGACGQDSTSTTRSGGEAAEPAARPSITGSPAPTAERPADGDTNVGEGGEPLFTYEPQLIDTAKTTWTVPEQSDVLAAHGAADGSLWLWISDLDDSRLWQVHPDGTATASVLGDTSDLGFQFNGLRGISVDEGSGDVWVGTRTTVSRLDVAGGRVQTFDLHGVVPHNGELDAIRPPALSGLVSISAVSASGGAAVVGFAGSSTVALIDADGRVDTLDLAHGEVTALETLDGVTYAGLRGGDGIANAVAVFDRSGMVELVPVNDSNTLTRIGSTVLAGGVTAAHSTVDALSRSAGTVSLRRSELGTQVPWFSESGHGVAVARVPFGFERWTSTSSFPDLVEIGLIDCDAIGDSPEFWKDDDQAPKDCPLSTVWAVPAGDGSVWFQLDFGLQSIVRWAP